jgi:multiple sugar transport system substrate-binding protein
VTDGFKKVLPDALASVLIMLTIISQREKIMHKRTFPRREFLKIAGLAAAAGTLSACVSGIPGGVKSPPAPGQAPAAAKVSGNLMVFGGKVEITEKDIQGFLAKYPDVKVDQQEPDSARLKALVAAGTPPDVIRTDGAELQNLAQRGIPLDISDFLKASAILKEDDFAPSCEYYHVKGKWYGLPKDWSPDFSFFGNTTLMQAAGVIVPPVDKSIRYAEIFDLGRKLTKKEGDRILVAGYAYEMSFFARQIMSILLEEDMYLYSEDFGKIILNDNPLLMDVLKAFTDISKEGITWSPLNPCKTWPGQEYILGTEGLVGYGYWFSATINDPGKDARVDGKTSLFFPAPSWGGKKTVNPTFGGSGYISARESKSPEAAWSFLEWYLGDTPAKDRASKGWGVPALKSLYPLMPQANNFQKQVQAVLQYTFENGDSNFALKFNPYYADQVFNDSWNKNLAVVLNGSGTLEQAVAAVEEEVNAAIEYGKKAS